MNPFVQNIRRGLWFVVGVICLIIGIIGLLLPVIPQVPFLLAALLCFMRVSERFNNWVRTRRFYINLQNKMNQRRQKKQNPQKEV